MNKKFLLLSCILITSVAYAQVGINTNEPKTTLDVSVKRDNGIIDNTQTYGVQTPRLTREELTNLTATYGSDQNGALIYITDVSGGNNTAQRINITTVGFYYFDGNVWQPIRDTSIYKANGTISGEKRIVYFNNTSSDNGKMIFTAANNGANIPQTFLNERAPMFSLLGNDSVGNLKPEHGIYISNGLFGNGMRKEAHLWGGQQISPTNKIQFLAYSSLDGNILMQPENAYNSGPTAYLGGKPFSESSMVVDNIKLVVNNKRVNSSLSANERSTVPFKINGFASKMSGDIGVNDVWRTAVTIENTDLYLTNLEHGTTEVPAPAEVEGQVLTLVKNTYDNNKLKAVWRAPGALSSNAAWNVLNSNNKAENSMQNIYQTGRVFVKYPNNYISTANTSLLGSNFNVYENLEILRQGSPSVLALSNSNGTLAAPTNTLANNNLGHILFEGYSNEKRTTSSNPENFSNGKSIVAQMQGLAMSDFSSEANASGALTFSTKGIGSTLSERMRINSNGYVGINKIAPTATVDVVGNITDPALRITNLPTSNNPKTESTVRTDVNYNKLTPLHIDDKGNVVKIYDPSSGTATTFDGTYSVPTIASTDPITATTGILITKVNSYSVLNFDFYTSLQLGLTDVGSNLLATVSFGSGTGITSSKVSSGSGSATAVYKLEPIEVYNNADNLANLQTSLTFDYPTLSNKFVLRLFYVNIPGSGSENSGEIRAVVLRYGNATSESNLNVNIFNSRRFR